MNLFLKEKNKFNKDSYDLMSVRRFLSDNFLFRADVTSAQILLNICNIEEAIENIYPSYISLVHLKKDIISILRNKEGIELIAYNISNLIRDDINRLELVMYLEGYINGFNDKDVVNQLEILAFKHLGLEELYKRRKLFNYELKDLKILEFKKSIFNDLRKSKELLLFIKRSIVNFYIKTLRLKIKDINSHIDRQLVFEFKDGKSKFVEQDSRLRKKEIQFLSKKITRFMYADAMKVYENAYWDGANDKVIKRYK